MKRTPSLPRGLSYVEVAVATAILSMVLLMVFTILHQTHVSHSRGAASGEAEDRSRKTVAEVKTELLFSKIVLSDFPSDGHYIRYQHPSPAGALAWGYADSGGTHQAGWSAVLRFIPEKVYLEPDSTFSTVLPTERYEFDLNDNGLRTDAFAVGKLYREVYDGADNTATRQRRIGVTDDVVLNATDYSADVNGDPDPDPLFTLLDATGTQTIPSPGTVKMVRINVWHGKFDTDHKAFFLRQGLEEIQLRNPQ